ncbi:MAG: hypothetical protein HY706_12160, partial [Candidatus Hydrogenedentes bacterium]|nr:hypothetical protein [Candidatus Hydrogenedentota bacterium]
MAATLDNFARKCARPAELLLGVVFVAGAVLKMLDINLFVVQVRHYGVIQAPAGLDAVAVGTVALESALGVALLLGGNSRRFTLPIIAALLVLFTGLILYGWRYHNLADCGCFGRLKMTPGTSILKNVVLLAGCGFAWRYRPRASSAGVTETTQVASFRVLDMLRVSLPILAAVGAGIFAYTHLEAPTPVQPDARPFAQFVFEEDGQTWNLGEGEYLVAMLSATCEHCMAAVAELNDFVAAVADLPLFGLCEGTEETLQSFRDQTAPLFPTHLIGVRAFFELIGQEPPRFIYI